MAKSRARVRSGIWQLENNEPLQSGTLKKRPKLHSERGLSRICRKPRAPLSAKREPKAHERNGQGRSEIPRPFPKPDHDPRQDRTRSLALWGHSTFGRLCGNLIYFAFSRDLPRPSSVHLCLIYNPSRCRGLSAFV